MFFQRTNLAQQYTLITDKSTIVNSLIINKFLPVFDMFEFEVEIGGMRIRIESQAGWCHNLDV